MLLSVETLFAKGIADIAEALPSSFGFKLTRPERTGFPAQNR
jgi:hypothetical protein